MGVGIGCLGLIILAIIFFSIDGMSSGTLYIFVFLALLLSFGGLIYDAMRKSKLSDSLVQKIRNLINGIENFNVSQEFISVDRESLVAIDEENKKLLIVYNEEENMAELSEHLSKYNYSYKIFPYNEILQSEILEDDVTVTKTSRGSQLGGALLGGIFAGGVGAIIGGLSGSTKSTTNVKKIQLQIVVNDLQQSFYRITFMSNDYAIEKKSSEYIKVYKEVTHWHNIIKIVIDTADKEDRLKEKNLNTDATVDYLNSSDEIRKLHQLFIEGIITQEEFESQKKKILSK